MKHESVKDAAVIGVPNDISGEIPTAFVVKKPESTIGEKELVDYAAGTLVNTFLIFTGRGKKVQTLYSHNQRKLKYKSQLKCYFHFSALVSPQKKLRGGVIFTEEIPKNPSGKILRRKLKEIYVTLRSRY